MKKLLLLSLFSFVVLAFSWGQSIFENPITGTNPNNSNPYTTGQTFNANITVSGIGRGSGAVGTNANDRYNANSWNTTSIDLTAYFYFTLTPNSGREINFSSLDFGAQVSGTGPTQFAFRSSLDGFASDIASPSIPNDAIPHSYNISLSGTSFQNITTPITFRLYAWGTTSSTGTFSINDFIFNGATALPIELSSFSAKAVQSSALLSFATFTERNNDYFSIERGSNTASFSEIGQVAGAGDSNIPNSYTFTDHKPLPGKNYYRLRQVDFDGKYSYSNVVSVNFGHNGGLTLSPMPTNNELRVVLDEPAREDGFWQVMDMSGRTIRSGTFPAESSNYSLNASDLPDGSYVFRLIVGQEALAKKFRKAD